MMKMTSLSLASIFQADATLQTVSHGHRTQTSVTHNRMQGKSQILLEMGQPLVCVQGNEKLDSSAKKETWGSWSMAR